MGFVFIVLLGVVVVTVAIGAAKARMATLNQSWTVAAAHLGLSLQPGTLSASPRIDGDVDGFPVSVDIHKRGSGKSQSIWTRFQIGVPSLPPGIELKQEGFLSGISKVFGAQDIEVGDDAFDSQVVVKGHNEAALRAFLTPVRRVRIRRLFESYLGAVVDAKGVSWMRRGRISDSSRVVVAVRDLLRVARSLAGDEPEDRPLEKALHAQNEGVLEEAMSNLRQRKEVAGSDASPLEPAEPDEKLLEGNLLYLSGRHDEAKQVFHQALEAAPKDAEARGWAALAAATSTTAAAAIPAKSSDERAVAADGLDVGAFCETVFSSGSMSFEAARTFEERYLGKRVHWSGTLKSAEPYRYDFVFGSGEGVKATLAIHEVEATAFGDGEVKAVIQLPAGTEGLDAKIGERMAFSGTLSKLDGFVRNVFVTDARLE